MWGLQIRSSLPPPPHSGTQWRRDRGWTQSGAGAWRAGGPSRWGSLSGREGAQRPQCTAEGASGAWEEEAAWRGVGCGAEAPARRVGRQAGRVLRAPLGGGGCSSRLSPGTSLTSRSPPPHRCALCPEVWHRGQCRRRPQPHQSSDVAAEPAALRGAQRSHSGQYLTLRGDIRRASSLRPLARAGAALVPGLEEGLPALRARGGGFWARRGQVARRSGRGWRRGLGPRGGFGHRVSDGPGGVPEKLWGEGGGALHTSAASPLPPPPRCAHCAACAERRSHSRQPGGPSVLPPTPHPFPFARASARTHAETGRHTQFAERGTMSGSGKALGGGGQRLEAHWLWGGNMLGSVGGSRRAGGG